MVHALRELLPFDVHHFMFLFFSVHFHTIFLLFTSLFLVLCPSFNFMVLSHVPLHPYFFPLTSESLMDRLAVHLLSRKGTKS